MTASTASRASRGRWSCPRSCFLRGTRVLDNLGQVAYGTALEQRFSEVIPPPTEARESLAGAWWNIAIGMRRTIADKIGDPDYSFL